MKLYTRALMLVFGCIFAGEGYVLLQLGAWVVNVTAHWMVASLVSIVFFYLGLVVASVFLMAARDDIVKSEEKTAIKQLDGVARRPAAQRNYAEAGAR
jgi:hypothetical protein